MQIKDFLNKYNIQFLYHFTDIANIPLIRQHGILPYTELQKNEIIPPKPGGNEISRNADRSKGVDKYVHLCFKDQHPMEFRAREDKRIESAKFLRISTDVLNFNGVMGCTDVSNKTGVTIMPIEEALEKIDTEILFGNIPNTFQDPELKKRYNEAKKSEILIPAPIRTNLILNLT